MRATVCFLFVVAFPLIALADDLGKTKKFRKGDLPRSITATTSNGILVVGEGKPGDVKNIKTFSDTSDVEARAVEMEGELHIVNTGDKKGDTKISWGYSTQTGGDGGAEDLNYHIQ
jgi:hypothetical protein